MIHMDVLLTSHSCQLAAVEWYCASWHAYGVQAGEQVWWPLAAIHAEHPQHPQWTMQQCLSQPATSAQACDQVDPALHGLHGLKLLLQRSSSFSACKTTIFTCYLTSR